jgi:hypothetical protein
MIQAGRGRRQLKTGPSLELLQSPDTSMVPGFVLIPVVTLPGPARQRSRLGEYCFCTTWAAALGDFQSR